MICNKCGNTLPDDSEFCQYCGSRIERENIDPQGVSDEETLEPIEANSKNQPDLGSEMSAGGVPEKARKAKKVKEPKKKYCSRCGSLIDPQSKQCTGCGKKYIKGIRFNKFSVVITVLSLVIVALIGLNIYQYLYNYWINEQLHKKHITIENLEMENKNLDVKNGNLEEEIEDLEGEVSELKTEVHSQRTTISHNDQAIERLEAQISEYAPIVGFCKDYVEIIGDDGTNYYHKYGCPYLDLSNGFLVLNTEAAKVRGFTECPYCRYSLH